MNEKPTKLLPVALVAVVLMATVGAINAMLWDEPVPAKANADGTPRRPAPHVWIYEEPVGVTPTPPATQPTIFPVTQPTTAPSTQPTTEPATQPVPATQPTVEIPPAPPVAVPATQPVQVAPPVIVPPPAPPVVPATQPLPATQPVAVPPTVVAPATQPAQTQPASEATPTTEPSEAEAAPEATHLTQDWFPWRSPLEDRGVAFDLSLATYFGGNLTGGAQADSGGVSDLLNFNVTLDSKRLLGYDGGTFFANLRQENGLQRSLDGAFGHTSSLYEPDRTQVSEIWYQQQTADQKFRVKIGKIDANTEFASVQNGGEFLNDFATFPVTILSFPTDPDPAFGACGFFTPTDNLYASAGVFDGSLQEGIRTGLRGPAELFRGPDSAFSILEAGTKWTLPGGRDGRLGAGVWYHSGRFPRFDGGSDNGASGPYVTFDQTLWKSLKKEIDHLTGWIAANMQPTKVDRAKAVCA